MPAPASVSTTDRDARWLSLGPASRLLGIDPDTLRRWADQGRVASWTTPGGHRRFERSALERLVAARRSTRGQVLSTLGGSPERLAKAYRRYYAVDPATAGRGGPTGGTADADREAHRRDGRRLIAALLAYLDADPRDTRTRAQLEGDAEAIVDDQARRLAAGGVGLTESVSGFVAARGPFLAELAGLGYRRSLDPGRLAALYGDASSVLDRLLLRFIAAHQGSED
jgi:excisionase family DNA binding protein